MGKGGKIQCTEKARLRARLALFCNLSYEFGSLVRMDERGRNRPNEEFENLPEQIRSFLISVGERMDRPHDQPHCDRSILKIAELRRMQCFEYDDCDPAEALLIVRLVPGRFVKRVDDILNQALLSGFVILDLIEISQRNLPLATAILIQRLALIVNATHHHPPSAAVRGTRQPSHRSP